jgi:hypothetical protein
VNGESISPRNADHPTTLLVDFLRSNTVFFAIKHSILAARAQLGVRSWFALDPPPTVECIQQACMLNDFGAP